MLHTQANDIVEIELVVLQRGEIAGRYPYLLAAQLLGCIYVSYAGELQQHELLVHVGVLDTIGRVLVTNIDGWGTLEPLGEVGKRAQLDLTMNAKWPDKLTDYNPLIPWNGGGVWRG